MTGQHRATEQAVAEGDLVRLVVEGAWVPALDGRGGKVVVVDREGRRSSLARVTGSGVDAGSLTRLDDAPAVGPASAGNTLPPADAADPRRGDMRTALLMLHDIRALLDRIVPDGPDPAVRLAEAVRALIRVEQDRVLLGSMHALEDTAAGVGRVTADDARVVVRLLADIDQAVASSLDVGSAGQPAVIVHGKDDHDATAIPAESYLPADPAPPALADAKRALPGIPAGPVRVEVDGYWLPRLGGTGLVLAVEGGPVQQALLQVRAAGVRAGVVQALSTPDSARVRPAPECGARSPSELYLCSRRAGHEGDHHVTDHGYEMARWPSTSDGA